MLLATELYTVRTTHGVQLRLNLLLASPHLLKQPGVVPNGGLQERMLARVEAVRRGHHGIDGARHEILAKACAPLGAKAGFVLERRDPWGESRFARSNGEQLHSVYYPK